MRRRHLSNATRARPPEAVASLSAMDGDDAPMPTLASDSAPRFDLLLAHTDSVFCVIERAPAAGKLLLVSDSARRVLGAYPDDLVTCVAPLSCRRRILGLTVLHSRCFSRSFLDLFPEDRGAAAALLAAAATSKSDAPPAVAHLRAPATGAYESGGQPYFVSKSDGSSCRTFLEAKLSSDVRDTMLHQLACSCRGARARLCCSSKALV
jgi:hypothetical protein